MSARVIDEAANVFADPRAYTDETRLHAALTHLRADAPVSWVDVPTYRPFWAITKHADIMDIERDNTCSPTCRGRCWPSPRPTRQQAADGRAHADPHGRSAPPRRAQDRRGLVPPEGHAGTQGPCRRTGQDLGRQDGGEGPECDFVQEIAVNYPLYVILTLLGLPESDFPRMLKLTQEMFGGDDDEFQRGRRVEDSWRCCWTSSCTSPR